MGKTLDASVRILRADGGKRGPKEDMRVSIIAIIVQKVYT
jgi:hypothetical protein